METQASSRVTQTNPALLTQTRIALRKRGFRCLSPDEVTAEDKAQDEDEDACAEDDHVDVKRQVLEGDGWHGA